MQKDFGCVELRLHKIDLGFRVQGFGEGFRGRTFAVSSCGCTELIAVRIGQREDLPTGNLSHTRTLILCSFGLINIPSFSDDRNGTCQHVNIRKQNQQQQPVCRSQECILFKRHVDPVLIWLDQRSTILECFSRRWMRIPFALTLFTSLDPYYVNTMHTVLDYTHTPTQKALNERAASMSHKRTLK